MPNYYYHQRVGGEEAWHATPAVDRQRLEAEDKPVFITVLAVSQIIEDDPESTHRLSHEEKLKLAYAGPLYFDWDSSDELLVIEKVNQFLDNLESMRVDLDCCRLYATGGRGYHLEIPPKVFMTKVPPRGIVGLPAIYREMAYALAVDTLDLKIYSGGRGRMWRTPNVKRTNGRYKVPISVEEMRSMTPGLCLELTSAPRQGPALLEPKFAADLAIEFDKAQKKVDDLLAKRKRYKPDPQAAKRAQCDSILSAMFGLGIKPDAGFQDIATQLAIAATTAGVTEDAFVANCEGLIEGHVSDSERYATPAKRRTELRRMHRYMDGNMCYEFSVGAIKSLLTHSAPDLDGIVISKEDLLEEIKQANEDIATEMDEYKDVASGITLTRHGVWKSVDGSKRRICAVSFQNSVILISTENLQVVGYETDILVNGAVVGRQMLEMEVLSGLVPFNRFCAKYGHAFQGNDADVRTTMMRFVEQTKKRGKTMYVTKREGLDVLSIPNHENPVYRTPFLVWSDGNAVITEPRIAEAGLELTFQGFPDVRGVFKTDIAKAPALSTWLKEGTNRDDLRTTLEYLMSCQKAELMGKLIGWYTACFWKQIVHAVYGKFPLLHVNGAAGVGKCISGSTPVLLASGDTKLARDIEVGDQLLGPDGGIRNVLSTCSGREQMYRVTPVKGEPYEVNASHILSLRKSDTGGSGTLSDGTKVRSSDDIVNVNVEVYKNSTPYMRKLLKGWRSGPVEFYRPQETLEIDPYILGIWLGDGQALEPSICKPEHTQVVHAWYDYAEAIGGIVSRYEGDRGCPNFRLCGTGLGEGQGKKGRNPFTQKLRHYGLIGNKHIPDAYKFASVESRRALIAGLLDTDGHLVHSNYDWISVDQKLAEDFAFLCRSVGLACYVKRVTKGIKSRGFTGTYWRCCVSGDTDKLPCRDKKAPPRKQIKRALVTGIEVAPLGEGDYYGFTIDGDHLFMLGDFTVTHNTETNILLSSMFYFRQEVRPMSPASTVFALHSHLTASASIPLIIDEYKPTDMHRDLHNKMKLMLRDAYNQRQITRGGGTRESDDYRSLSATELAAPLVFIAEAAEDEAAVMERVVLATFSRPPQIEGLKNLAKFQHVRQNHEHLGMLGQYIAAKIVRTVSLESFRAEFDALYDTAKSEYLLNEKDLGGDLSADDLRNKQNAKERSVFNHTVAKFGFQQWRQLVNEIVPDDSLDPLMARLEDGIYARLADLNSATMPEHIKVLDEMAQMSHHVDKDRPDAIRLGQEYAFVQHGQRSCIEIAVVPAYAKYRLYCRTTGSQALFQSKEPFFMSLQDSPAFVKQGTGDELPLPKVFTFDMTELAKFGVNAFKTK